MAVKHTWGDFAILQSSSGGKEWKVQINEEGTFRCNCPSFIFSGRGGAIRSCKHCRRCKEDLVVEGTGLGAARAVPVSAAMDHPFLVTAQQIYAAMLKAAVALSGSEARKRMVDELAAQLAVFNPAAMPVVAHTVSTGVRRITFDD